MYEPAPHHAGSPLPLHPYGWTEPPRRRRRRLSRKGVFVLLAVFAVFCALCLALLKLGLVVWHAPVTQQVANSAARIGTVAADVAMKEAEVPEDLRKAVTAEAETIRREVIAPPRNLVTNGMAAAN